MVRRLGYTYFSYQFVALGRCDGIFTLVQGRDMIVLAMYLIQRGRKKMTTQTAFQIPSHFVSSCARGRP